MCVYFHVCVTCVCVCVCVCVCAHVSRMCVVRNDQHNSAHDCDHTPHSSERIYPH